MIRTIFSSIVAVAAVWGASATAATTYNVTSAGLYNSGTVRISGNIAGYGAFDSNEYAGAIVLQGTTAAGAPFSVITYCFDLLHPIAVGFGNQAGVNYSFTAAPITNDQIGGPGIGNPLSAGTVQRLSGLAQLGASFVTSNASDLSARSSAIQAAIWTTEYGLTASNFSIAGAQGFYDDYISRSFAGARLVPGLIARNAQGQIIGTTQGQILGSVPEPQSWALMIVGFGLVGVSARRRNRTKAVTA